MNIKKAGLSDLIELQGIGRRSYVPHYAHLWNAGGVDWYMRRCFGDEVLQSELADSNVEYYIVADEGESIGILKLVLQEKMPDSEIENALYLEKIYFVKEWTGRGVGRELMQIAFNRAEELKRECVWLTAMDTSDKPVAAYKRAGFAIHSRAQLDFELMKEEFRGMFVMKKCSDKNDD